jgi:hypothetical protein
MGLTIRRGITPHMLEFSSSKVGIGDGRDNGISVPYGFEKTKHSQNSHRQKKYLPQQPELSSSPSSE